MEPTYQNRDLISESSLDLKIELRFQMELSFANRALISKWSIDFEMELRF